MEMFDDPTGFVAEARARGGLRFVPAAFLAVWLCGWAVGEVFAIGMVLYVTGLFEWIPVLSTWPHGDRPAPGFALAITVFLTVWLALWTLGGWAAAMQLGRLLAGVDRVRWDGATLAVEQRPFVARRRIAREQIRDVKLRRRDRALVALTDRGEVELMSLADKAQRTELRDALRRRLGMGEATSAYAAATATLPDGWEADHAEDGACRLRRVRPASLSRTEWRIAPGRLERRRTWFGRSQSRMFAPPILRVTISRDSDGDEWFEFEVSDALGRATMLRAMNAEDDVLRLARWVADATGVHLDVAADLKRAG